MKCNICGVNLVVMVPKDEVNANAVIVYCPACQRYTWGRNEDKMLAFQQACEKYIRCYQPRQSALGDALKWCIRR